MELQELLTAVGEYVAGDEAKARDLAQAIRKDDAAKPVATVLLNAGAGKKKGETQQREKELQDQITALTEERDGLIQERDAAQGQPNEKVTAAERERDKAREKAAKLEADLKAEREGRKSDRVSTKAEKVVGKLRGQVDDDYLDEVLTPRIQKRIRPTDEDVEFLADDETPYDGDDKARAESLAADLLKVVPDKYRLRPMNPGGGGGRGGQGAVTVEQLQREKAQSGAYSL